MIGDDNSDCFRGTWNTDYTVKTVTKATASVINNNCDLVFFAVAPSSNQDSRAGVYYSDGKVGIITAIKNNFKPSIDKPIPLLVYYNYRDSSIGPSYYYWYQNRSVLTSSNLSVLNGTYNFTFDFDYLGKHYSIKKKLIYSYQFTSTVKLSSNSSYATINKDIPVGYFFTNLGDDNSDALRGTWNADRTVKTVTSSTADWSDYLNSGADIVFLNSDIHDGLTCLKFSDGRNVNIPQNFEVTIDKMIPFYEYHQGNDNPSFPTHRKDGYYFYLTISPIWFTSLSNANILLSNRNNMNGSYNFTFKFNYNNKDYSFKKTLVISF